jgi:hypothetical protein
MDQTSGQQSSADSRYHHQGRQDTPSSSGCDEKGRGSQAERNLGGDISNRGMDREMEEQEELPDRDSRQSDR